MPRYKLTIAYDGTDFCGWQKQEPVFAPTEEAPNAGETASGADGRAIDAGAPSTGEPPYQPHRSAAYLARLASHAEPGLEAGRPGRIALRTVQAVVERAVREIVREPVALVGASRTDAGVHAWGQVAAFSCGGDEASGVAATACQGDTPSEDAPGRTGWPVSRGVERLLRALNGRLPDDVVVRAAEVAAPTFEPIGHARAKEYSYRLHVSPPAPRGPGTRPLWDRRYCLHVWHELDVGAMRRATTEIVGEHDFAAFAAAGHGRLSTVRAVHGVWIDVEPRGLVAPVGEPGLDPGVTRVRIRVRGGGFLYHMVRIIAGTLVEVGRGRMTPEDVRAAIASRDRARAGPTLPAHGLCLDEVEYGDGAGVRPDAAIP